MLFLNKSPGQTQSPFLRPYKSLNIKSVKPSPTQSNLHIIGLTTACRHDLPWCRFPRRLAKLKQSKAIGIPEERQRKPMRS